MAERRAAAGVALALACVSTSVLLVPPAGAVQPAQTARLGLAPAPVPAAPGAAPWRRRVDAAGEAPAAAPGGRPVAPVAPRRSAPAAQAVAPATPPAAEPAAPAADPVAEPAAEPTAEPVAEPAAEPAAPAAEPVNEPTAAAPVTSSLDAVIARIPSYVPGGARWVRRAYAGHLGAADWYSGTIYISPEVPPSRLYSVAVHEWSHLLQVRIYGSVPATVHALNAAFGGTGMTGVERAADCMARLQGATWTHYTTCDDPRWRAAAARLVSGRRA